LTLSFVLWPNTTKSKDFYDAETFGQSDKVRGRFEGDIAQQNRMRKRLLILVVAGLGIILIFWHTINSQPAEPRLLGGPAKLVLYKPVSGASQALQPAAPPQTNALLRGSAGDALPATNFLLAQLTNPGPKSLELWGYDSSAPLYAVYVQDTNGLKRFQSRELPGSVSILRLGPTQSLTFTVLCPATDQSWFVGISYRELVPPNPPLRPRSRLDQLIDGFRSALPLSRGPALRSYFATNEPICFPVAPNRALQRLDRSSPKSKLRLE
jgi:hypothetical protein